MSRSLTFIVAAARGLGPPAMALTADVPSTTQSVDTPSQWHAQKLSFNYSGFTTLYTCDGLEDKVREILLTFGARKDAKVRATGCTEGFNRPSKFAWVTAEFSSLAPVVESTAADGVKSQWAKVRLAPNRPSYMGDGECELVEQMRDLLQKGFALRNTEYRTQCTPHQVSIADYNVTTEVLKVSP